jgi:hypothetical protein
MHLDPLLLLSIPCGAVSRHLRVTGVALLCAAALLAFLGAG